MTKRKPGMTREEHFALGGKLLDVRCVLMGASVAISNAYPWAGNESIAAARAVKALDKLRCRLDSAICRETAPDDQDALRAYYGKGGRLR